LKAALEKHFNRGFLHQYVLKIAHKVAREGLIEADRTQIEERMNPRELSHDARTLGQQPKPPPPPNRAKNTAFLFQHP
jgi:hypothetical protein